MSNKTSFDQGSSSSVSPHEPQTQVSSVDFATLSKQTTNSSHGSSMRSNKSYKRSLSRLFSRTRASVDTFHLRSKKSDKGDLDVSNKDEMEIPKTIALESKRSESSRSLTRLERKIPSSSELSVQTGSLHKSKFSRGMSGNPVTAEGKTLKKSQVPPIYLNGLFHRSHSSTNELKGGTNMENRESYQSGSNTNSKKSTVQLSSQSSNSYISDRASAMSYHFTNPGHISGFDENHENTSLLELHRRYMLSADLYLQKLHRTTNEEMSSSATNPTEEHSVLGSEAYDEHYGRAFSEIYEIIEPIFYPPKQNLGSSGSWVPPVPLSTEQAASYVDERLLRTRRILNRKSGEEQQASKLVSSTRQPRDDVILNNFIPTEETDDEITELELKEFSTRISSFFLKCCHALAVNFMDDKHGKLPGEACEIVASRTDSEPEDQCEYVSFLENWGLIAQAWTYFNSRVRFYLLHVFLPAEMHLDYLCSKNASSTSREGGRSVNLEKELLDAFREAFIVPQLRLRKVLFPSHALRTPRLQNAVLTEINIFTNKNNHTSDLLTNCFGVLSSYATRDFISEDMQPGDVLFSEFMRCLKSFSR